MKIMQYKSPELMQLLRRFAVAALFAVPLVADAAELDPEMVKRGEYLTEIAGCNHCHTEGYLVSEGNVPKEEWLKGDTFGWRGPWGTTYGSNLRMFAAGMSEDEWVEATRTLRRLPPMPWFDLNRMAEADSRALYQFIRSLGEPGGPAPAYVPPDQEPNPPYAVFPSPPE
jgi:mono/diheme cytochrome c family protein